MKGNRIKTFSPALPVIGQEGVQFRRLAFATGIKGDRELIPQIPQYRYIVVHLVGFGVCTQRTEFKEIYNLRITTLLTNKSPQIRIDRDCFNLDSGFSYEESYKIF